MAGLETLTEAHGTEGRLLVLLGITLAGAQWLKLLWSDLQVMDAQ